MDYDIAHAIELELYHFQWAFPGRAENRGEISVDRDTNELVLEVWCRDNDDPEDEILKPLIVRQDIDTNSARAQIRSIIHNYLCHEADEQIWFGDDRPFYPH